MFELQATARVKGILPFSRRLPWRSRLAALVENPVFVASALDLRVLETRPVLH